MQDLLLLDEPLSNLDAKLRAGTAKLEYQERGGYLKPVLDALGIPVESQLFVQSRTSFQAKIISPENPRSIFFNDQVAVGWMTKGIIELAAQGLRKHFVTRVQRVIAA